MRDIKFRGRALSNDKHANIKKGDFVFGSFIKTDIDAPAIVWGDGEQMEVDIETVGQFTGLTDKNGVDIYEGDIVIYRESSTPKNQNPDFIILLIEYENTNTSFRASSDWHGENPIHEDVIIEVIGNIYESPELLEKKS